MRSMLSLITLLFLVQTATAITIGGAVSIYYYNITDPEAGVSYFEIWQGANDALRFYMNPFNAIIDAKEDWYGWIPNKVIYGFKLNKAGLKFLNKTHIVNNTVRPFAVAYGFDTRFVTKGNAIQVIVHKYVYDLETKRWYKWCDVFGCRNDIIKGDGWIEAYFCKNGFQYVVFVNGL